MKLLQVLMHSLVLPLVNSSFKQVQEHLLNEPKDPPL